MQYATHESKSGRLEIILPHYFMHRLSFFVFCIYFDICTKIMQEWECKAHIIYKFISNLERMVYVHKWKLFKEKTV